MPRPSPDRWAPALRHLKRVDPRWGPILKKAGPCPLAPKLDRFATLVRAVIGQQISTRAATAIHQRLVATVGDPIEPERLLLHDDLAVQSAGLSASKAATIRRLAEAVASGELPLRTIGRWSEAAIIERLTSIRGIGPWTAEMFLIFGLARPDILSAGDLGIRLGLQRFHGLEALPSPRDCATLTEPWRPYRSIAMWYLWRGIENGALPAPSARPIADPPPSDRSSRP